MIDVLEMLKTINRKIEWGVDYLRATNTRPDIAGELEYLEDLLDKVIEEEQEQGFEK